MMSGSSLIASELDLSARSIDLVNVIAKSSGLVGHIAQEIIAWRNREGIDEQQLKYALSLAQNISHPNDNGSQMLECLKTKASELYSLQLVVPGAIGRSILADDALCWMATTHAVLFRYHDLKLSTDVLCDLSLAGKVNKSDGRRPVYMARIRPVIEKAVESIAIHTTNLGQGVAALPEQLQRLPRHFGQLASFAEVVHAIAQATESNLLVTLNRCLTDLLDWVYNHWHGELEVTYVNEVVFREVLGNGSSHLKFVILERCSPPTDCEALTHRVTARVSLLNEAWPKSPPMDVPLWEGAFGFSKEQQHKAWRAELYDLDYQSSNHVRLSEKEIRNVQKNAQEIVRSIMAMPVEPTTDSGNLALHYSRASDSKRLQWWVRRSPGILQANYGSRSTPRELFNPTDDLPGDVEMGSPVSSAGSPTFPAEAFKLHNEDQQFGQQRIWNVDLPDPNYDLVQLQRDYPELAEVAGLAGDRCECGCRKIGETVTLKGLDNEGCLRILSVFSTLVLVGHSLADALGVRDLSNLKKQGGLRNICDATIIILSQIASAGQVRWRHWFKLAASAATGIEHDVVDQIRPRVTGADDDFGSEHVAWTYGSMTVVPYWFKIGDRLELHRSWGITILVGKPASLTADRAVLESQPTTRVELSSAQSGSKVAICESLRDFPNKTSQVKAFTSVVSSSGPLHRIMTLITTEASLRILDPADIYRGYMYAYRPQCNKDFHGLAPHPVYLQSLDDVLQSWTQGTISRQKDGVEVYHCPKDILGSNIALALSWNNVIPGKSTVLLTEECCLFCALKEAHERRAVCVTSPSTITSVGSRVAQKSIGLLLGPVAK